MNAYAFEFDKKGKIVRRKAYNRTGRESFNVLLPFLAQLQAFSDATNFREFYRQNKETYEEQITFYRDAADIAGMQQWLNKNFPTSNNYDAYKIIFSPLVNGYQSSNWLESNGFKELHAHVNFPYPQFFRQQFQNV